MLKNNVIRACNIKFVLFLAKLPVVRRLTIEYQGINMTSKTHGCLSNYPRQDISSPTWIYHSMTLELCCMSGAAETCINFSQSTTLDRTRQ